MSRFRQVEENPPHKGTWMILLYPKLRFKYGTKLTSIFFWRDGEEEEGGREGMVTVEENQKSLNVCGVKPGMKSR